MTSQHNLEPTSFSLTSTVVNRPQDNDGHPSLIRSGFSGRTIASSSPGPLPNALPRPHPERSVSLNPGPRICPSVIPPTHTSRTLVLCFDGTGDQFDADNSNIVKLVSLLKKDDSSKQMVYYQSGIGTYTTPQIANPFISKLKMKLDIMLAWNLNTHLMNGYEFLMQTYMVGDRICLFGFSRGAYTARGLAGMLQKVGLLPAHNIQQVPFAYKMYTQSDDFGWEQSIEFKKTFCVDVNIDFIGVWDTVDSVGLVPRSLPFTTSNTLVRTFRHALSLDERRAKFKTNLWNRPRVHETTEDDMPRPGSPLGIRVRASSPLPDPVDEDINKNPHHKRLSSEAEERVLRHYEQLYAERQRQPTDTEEVWFTGCHCDVGGGSVSNKTRYSLARISLRWMIRECFKADTGIMFDCEGLRKLGLDPSSLYPFVTPRPPAIPAGDAVFQELPPTPPSWIRRFFVRILGKTLSPPDPASSTVSTPDATKTDEQVGTEEEEDLKDALSPIYDQLEIQPAWWILEFLPLRLRYQRGDSSWVSYIGSNLGAPRFIPSQHDNGVKMHRTVKTRMEAGYPADSRNKQVYSPRPDIRVDPIWID